MRPLELMDFIIPFSILSILLSVIWSIFLYNTHTETVRAESCYSKVVYYDNGEVYTKVDYCKFDKEEIYHYQNH